MINRAAMIVAMVVAFQVGVAQWSVRRETKRRWQHALTGHVLVNVSYMLPHSVCVAALLVAVIVMWGLCKYQHGRYFRRHFGPLLRPHELAPGRLPAAFYFLVGTLCTLLLVPMKTARYAVECLAFADPIAAWVGTSVRSPRITSSASLAGSCACFVVAWVIGYVYLETSSMTRITIGALACMTAEAWGQELGNDNLSIPILTATAVEYMS
jgi:dolichol kinase